jgi:hypothetical protein
VLGPRERRRGGGSDASFVSINGWELQEGHAALDWINARDMGTNAGGNNIL